MAANGSNQSDADAAGPAGRSMPAEETRPSLVVAILAIMCVVALAGAGWLANAWQQTSVRVSRAETARVAQAQEVSIAEASLARERAAREAAVMAGQESEARAGRERKAREAAERVGKKLSLALAREQSAHRAAVTARQESEARAAHERKAREAAERAMQEIGVELARERTASKTTIEQVLEEIDAARDAARVAEQQAGLARAAHEQAIDKVSRDAQALVEQARQASEQALVKLSAAQQALANERRAREEAERGLAQAREELVKARQARRDDPPKAHRETASAQQLASAAGDGWVTYRDQKRNFVFRYPADIFSPDPDAGPQQAFVSRDGKARLTTYSAVNDEGWSVSGYRDAMLKNLYDSAKIDYAPLRKSWFVLSGTKGAQMFYDRITFTCKGRAIHGWQLVYPVAERSSYDAIVERIHRSYKYDKSGSECG